MSGGQGHKTALQRLERVREQDAMRKTMQAEAATHVRLKHRAHWEADPPAPRGIGKGVIAEGGEATAARAGLPPPPAPFGTLQSHPLDHLELFTPEQRRAREAVREARGRAARAERAGEGGSAGVIGVPRPSGVSPPFATGDPVRSTLAPGAPRPPTPPFARGEPPVPSLEGRPRPAPAPFATEGGRGPSGGAEERPPPAAADLLDAWVGQATQRAAPSLAVRVAARLTASGERR